MNVGTLYELLDRLPESCDDFTVRFTPRDRSDWIQPECWRVVEGDCLILTVWDDGEGHDDDNQTVDRLKDLLDGYWNDECEEEDEVYFYQYVYVECDGIWHDILDDRFEINWKRERVDIFVSYD